MSAQAARRHSTGSVGPMPLFVIGAPKSGTTAICRFLAQHPQIFMCPIKEPGYFAAKELLAISHPPIRQGILEQVRRLEEWRQDMRRALPEAGLALGWDIYSALFDGIRGERVRGEGSVVYWWAAGTPAAIRERFADARFVVVLRDPADRFFSHCLGANYASPDTSCRDYFERARAGWPECALWLEAGNYGTILERYFSFFPRAQFSIHLYEDLCRDPWSVVTAILRFLEVDASQAIDVSGRFNETAVPRWPALNALRQRLLPAIPITRAWPASWRRVVGNAWHKKRADLSMAAADHREIADYYRAEVEQAGALIGRDLSSWLA